MRPTDSRRFFALTTVVDASDEVHTVIDLAEVVGLARFGPDRIKVAFRGGAVLEVSGKISDVQRAWSDMVSRVGAVPPTPATVPAPQPTHHPDDFAGQCDGFWDR